jgi:glutaredoxin
VQQREMVLYTRGHSLSCWRAGRFLSRAGYGFEVVDVGGDTGMLEKLSEAAHREVTPPHASARRKMAPPYVFVDRRPVGDMGTVRALAHSGRLEHLLRDRL